MSPRKKLRSEQELRDELDALWHKLSPHLAEVCLDMMRGNSRMGELSPPEQDVVLLVSIMNSHSRQTA